MRKIIPIAFLNIAFCLLNPVKADEVKIDMPGGQTITMVNIPGGSFLMGSCKLKDNEDELKAAEEENKKRAFLGQPALNLPTTADCNNPAKDANNNEIPQHMVSINAFQIGKTEVTVGQYKQFISATGKTNQVTPSFMKYNRSDDSPVVEVSWDSAQDFVKWMNQTQGGGWRLPSEAEWEYACRAGGQHIYCGSDNARNVAWYNGIGGDSPPRKATKQANAFGLYDMSGNAAEWVQDCWHDNYKTAPSDGSAWVSRCSRSFGLTGTEKVLRGGSWNYDVGNTRAAYRAPADTFYKNNFTGFRLARTP